MKFQSALFALALGAVSLASCSSDELGTEDKKCGHVSLLGVEVTNAEKVVNDAAPARAVTDVSDYIVELFRSGEDAAFQTYAFGEMPGVIELPEGNYFAKVRSHDIQKAEWERPYFVGKSEEFRIVANQITEVEPVKCVFSSLKVSIKFGPKLTAAIAGDAKVTVIANDEGKLVYSADDIKNGRAGYFETVDGSTTLVATFSGTINGRKDPDIIRTYTDVAAGQHRIITYELGAELPKPDEPMGSINPAGGITIDVSYVDQDLTADVDPGKEEVLPDEDEPGKLPEISGGDEPTPPGPGGDEPGPDVPPVTEDISFGGALKDGGNYTTQDLKASGAANVQIHCEKRCKDIKVKIESAFLNEEMLGDVGLATEFSLTDEKYYKAFGPESLNLPCGDQVKDQTDINFDIIGFMTLLEIGDNGVPNKFILTVTDSEGTVKTMSFTIVIKK